MGTLCIVEMRVVSKWPVRYDSVKEEVRWQVDLFVEGLNVRSLLFLGKEFVQEPDPNWLGSLPGFRWGRHRHECSLLRRFWEDDAELSAWWPPLRFLQFLRVKWGGGRRRHASFGVYRMLCLLPQTIQIRFVLPIPFEMSSSQSSSWRSLQIDPTPLSLTSSWRGPQGPHRPPVPLRKAAYSA